MQFIKMTQAALNTLSIEPFFCLSHCKKKHMRIFNSTRCTRVAVNTFLRTRIFHLRDVNVTQFYFILKTVGIVAMLRDLE